MKSRFACYLLLGVVCWAQTPPSAPPEKGKVVGRVISAATGDPVKKALVILSGAKTSLTASTDADGRYEIPDLDPGTYTLTVEREGYIEQTFGSHLVIGPEGTVEAGFKLIRQSVVTGRILNEDGEPAMRVTVELKKVSYRNGKLTEEPAGYAFTDDLGDYRIFDVAPGRYYVSATKTETPTIFAHPVTPPTDSYVPVYFPGTVDLQSATKLRVPRAAELHGIDITLQKVKSYRISGSVVGNMPDSKPDQIAVALSTQSSLSFGPGAEARVTHTQSDGSFDFRNIPPGDYEIYAHPFSDSSRIGFQEVTVLNDHVTGVTLQLQRGNDFHGTLKVEGDAKASVGEVSISLLRENGDTLPASGGDGSYIVDDDSSFEIENVVATRVRLILNNLPEGSYVKRVTAGEADFTGKVLDLAIVRGTSVDILLSPKAATVEGSVKNDRGDTVTSAAVVLVPDKPDRSNHELYKATALDQYGHYKIISIPPGSYTLYAFQGVEDEAWEDPDFLTSVESKGVAVSLAESDHPSNDLTVIVVGDQ